MIAVSTAVRTIGRLPALWLSMPGSPAEWPGRRRAEERSVRDGLFAALRAAGSSPQGGAALANSGGCVAYLDGASSQVGVDLEWLRPRDFAGLARFAYSATEADEIERLSPEARAAAFYVRWVLKEAAAKCLGLGLFEALAQCRFDVERGTLDGCLPGNAPFTARVYAPRPQLRLAWCAIGPAPQEPPVCIEWDPQSDHACIAAWPVVARTTA
jgi:hypothetical protein